MVNSIPANRIVSINPQVLAAGGSGIDLVGLILTDGVRVPIGSVISFANADDVLTYFGASSKESQMADIYFAGFTNSNIKPGALLFAQYAKTAVAAFLRGGSVASMTLAQIQALSGTIILTVDGTPVTSASINLSAATSFSNAATLIQTGIGASVVVTYDSIAGAFLIKSATTGAASTITYATGTLAPLLNLNAVGGAVLSQGSDVMVPATAMDAVTNVTQNFVSFTTTFVPSADEALAFAAWNTSKNSGFRYVLLDTAIAATTSNPATAPGYQVIAAGHIGVKVIYAPVDRNQAAAELSYPASVDFAQTQGRTNAKFRNYPGLLPDVTSGSIAAQLEANGYNFYGTYATRNDEFTFAGPGSITGPFKWDDSYINQIWMNDSFQVNLMVLLTQIRNLPYNVEGYGNIETAMMDTVNAALNNGAIQPGVTLSESQRAQVNAQAGVNIADTIEDRGYYILVQDASPADRADRKSPPVTFWYTDGQSVNLINVASVGIA